MAGRNGKKKAVAGLGLVSAGASVFFAAAALATGSAAPARADFDDLLDPIIQPLLSSFTDSLAAFDPAAATDLTSWSDTFLNSLNSTFDFAVPGAEPAAAVAAAAEPAASTGVYDLPVNLVGASGQPLTEPAVQALINGGTTAQPLLVDTGSSGVVIPYTDLDTSNSYNALLDLFKLGTPVSSGFSGYSGGVDYYYLTYNNVPISYEGGLTTDGPVSIEVFSYDPSNFFSLFSNNAFQDFLSGNGVNGILGIGPETAGPTTSPFESYGGVLVDLVGADKNLIVGGADPLTGGTLLTGSPSVAGLTETVTQGTTTIGTGVVTNDLDTGGVYGTIPSSIAGSGNLEGDTISVYQAGSTTPLYSYVVGAGQSPTVISGSSIDSGYIPFLSHEAYFNYGNDTTYWGPLTS